MTTLLHACRPLATASAAAQAVMAMTTFQAMAMVSRPLVDSIGAPAVTWLRMALAAAVLLVVTQPNLRRLPMPALGAALMMGGALALMSTTYIAAVSRLPLGLVAIIAYLGPLAVALAGARGWGSAGIALLAALGVALTVGWAPTGSGWSLDRLGLVFAALTGLGFALYILITRRVGQMFQGNDGLTISMLTAMLLLTPFSLSGMEHIPPASVVLGSAALGLFAPLLTCWAEMRALRRLGTQSFSVLISLEPAIAALLGLAFLHEVPSPLQAVGVLCVVLAAVASVTVGAKVP